MLLSGWASLNLCWPFLAALLPWGCLVIAPEYLDSQSLGIIPGVGGPDGGPHVPGLSWPLLWGSGAQSITVSPVVALETSVVTVAWLFPRNGFGERATLASGVACSGPFSSSRWEPQPLAGFESVACVQVCGHIPSTWHQEAQLPGLPLLLSGTSGGQSLCGHSAAWVQVELGSSPSAVITLGALALSSQCGLLLAALLFYPFLGGPAASPFFLFSSPSSSLIPVTPMSSFLSFLYPIFCFRPSLPSLPSLSFCLFLFFLLFSQPHLLSESICSALEYVLIDWVVSRSEACSVSLHSWGSLEKKLGCTGGHRRMSCLLAKF